MLLEEAAGLIKSNSISQTEPEVWAELGCGSGTFTNALASILIFGSIIYAVDKNKSQLSRISDEIKNVRIEKVHGNFIQTVLPQNLNGILMANSFHYVKDKNTFIKKIEKNLKLEGSFIIVEYDMDNSNPWVPYPLSFNSLKKFFEKFRYTSITKLNEHPSMYRRANIYSALIIK